MMGGGSFLCSSQSSSSSSANSGFRKRTTSEIMSPLKFPKWKCPREDWLKINFSVDADYNSGIGGIGIVLRELEGNILEVIATHYVYRTYQYGVARAAFIGLLQALNYQKSKISLEVEGDAEMSLILNDTCIACEEAMRVLADVRQLLNQDEKGKFLVSPIVESQNRAARWLAREARIRRISEHWKQNLEDLSDIFLKICAEDRDNS